jgi:flagellin-specific chaperone FliS
MYYPNGTIITTGPQWTRGVEARELYDLDVDPLELSNVAEDPARASEVEMLSHKLRKGWRGALQYEDKALTHDFLSKFKVG